MENKNIRRKLIWQTILAVVLIVSLVVLLVIQYAQFWSLSIKESKLKEQLALIQQERAVYEKEYQYKSSDEFLEDYAHEVLGWGREGESYYKS